MGCEAGVAPLTLVAAELYQIDRSATMDPVQLCQRPGAARAGNEGLRSARRTAGLTARSAELSWSVEHRPNGEYKPAAPPNVQIQRLSNRIPIAVKNSSHSEGPVNQKAAGGEDYEIGCSIHSRRLYSARIARTLALRPSGSNGLGRNGKSTFWLTISLMSAHDITNTLIPGRSSSR